MLLAVDLFGGAATSPSRGFTQIGPSVLFAYITAVCCPPGSDGPAQPSCGHMPGFDPRPQTTFEL